MLVSLYILEQGREGKGRGKRERLGMKYPEGFGDGCMK